MYQYLHIFQRVQSIKIHHNRKDLLLIIKKEGRLKGHLPFKYPLISGIPDPAAAGANFVTINTEDSTKAKLNKMYTRNPTKYELCIILKVNEYFHPAKFSTEILMKTAANPVPKREKEQKEISYIKKF